MNELGEFVADAEGALIAQDFDKLYIASESFLDYFVEHFMSDEWKTHSTWEQSLPALIGLEVSHFGFGKEVGLIPRFLTGLSAFETHSRALEVLRWRWALICLPQEIANIERDWKGCLQSVARMVSDSSLLNEEVTKFQAELLNRAGVECMSQLKRLMHQVAQFQALMGSILTELEAEPEVKRLLAEWFFASDTERLIPGGYSV